MRQIAVLFQRLFGRSLRAGFSLQFPIMNTASSKQRCYNREIFTAIPNALRFFGYFVY